MRRMHLIEIHEQPWCPASLRDALTDYLQFAIESGNPYGAIVLWDGVVSCLRTYSPAELRELTNGLGAGDYLWESGEEKYARSLIPVTYLIGYPSTNFAEEGAMEKR